MNRIFYILVICCQAFGVSAQSVADAGLFTYSAAGTPGNHTACRSKLSNICRFRQCCDRQNGGKDGRKPIS